MKKSARKRLKDQPSTPHTDGAPTAASGPARNAASDASDIGAARRHFAVVGAGMAGIACARTLVQAGHEVTVFESTDQVGGRMATHESAYGTFDSGVQYFTVRDARFARALETATGICRPWSANTVRVLDPLGRVASASLPPREPHWVATPGMDALLRHWAKPLLADGRLQLSTRVVQIERDVLNRKRWQLRTEGMPGAAEATHVFSGFDGVLLAVPDSVAVQLLGTASTASKLAAQIAKVQVAPCWTLMVAFPQAVQPGLITLGPHWNAARSTHHRIAWLARESSKPGRGSIERWTIQASAAWSQEHIGDDPERIRGKLCKAFSEVTGIRATPSHAEVLLWPQAQTVTPLAPGAEPLWDAKNGLGACGDWCRGHRVEDAFLAGLDLALAVA